MARRLAEGVMSSMSGTSPILVNSAGCGAMLKGYGGWIGTREAETFSSRVVDVHEWIGENSGRLKDLSRSWSPKNRFFEPVIVQEPCHLRKVQGVSIADVLQEFVPVRRILDDDMCCGAGGSYSLVQPEMARDIARRKTRSIRSLDPTGLTMIATSNPGCHLHLAAQGNRMVSSVELIADSLGSTDEKRRSKR